MGRISAELRNAVLAFLLAGSASTGLVAWAGLNVTWWLLLLALNTLAALTAVGLGWEWRRQAPLAGGALALALALLGAAAGQAFVLPAQLLSDPLGVREASVVSVLLIDHLGVGGAGLYYAAVLIVLLAAWSLLVQARRLLRAEGEETAGSEPRLLFFTATVCFALNALFVQSWIDPAVIRLEAVDSAGKALAVLAAAALAVAAAHRPAAAAPVILQALAETPEQGEGGSAVRRALTLVLYIAVAGLAVVVAGLVWGKQWPMLRPWLALVWWVCAPLVLLVGVLTVARWGLERLRSVALSGAAPASAGGSPPPPTPQPAPQPGPARLMLDCAPAPKRRRKDWLPLVLNVALALAAVGAVLLGFGLSALWNLLLPVAG
jgi:hypothetical protein